MIRASERRGETVDGPAVGARGVDTRRRLIHGGEPEGVRIVVDPTNDTIVAS